MTISTNYSLYNSLYNSNTPFGGITFDNGKVSTSDNKTNQETANKKNGLSGYSLSNMGNLSAVLSEVMKGMGLGKNDPVTFHTIMQYRDQLSDSFAEKTKEGLKAAGVDEEAKFQVVAGKDGGIEVISDHPDKDKIVKFFEDNPALVKQFEKIQALTNVEESRKYNGFDVKATRERIQIESMTAWFASTGQGVSSIMDFTGGQDALLMAGINRRV